MRFLPENFLSNDLSAVDARKLEYFYEQFVIRNADVYGKGHFVLACYAALPAVLTPDLLHKIWLNFKNYSLDGNAAVIHPVAPADILLSPLVEEIGVELYEMPEQIRKAFLLYLKEATATPENNSFKFFDLSVIAEFLKDYISYDFTPDNKDDDAFREAQEWTALSYLDPGKAFAEVAQAFQQSQTNAGRARYKDAIEKMSTRFALNIVKDAAAVPKDFIAMRTLTSVVRDVLQDRASEGLDQLKEQALKSKDLLTSAPIKAPNIISIEIPEEVGKKMMGVQISSPEKKGKLKALIVGVTVQNSNTDQNDTDEKTAQLFYNSIAGSLPEQERELKLISGNEATRDTILNAWKTLQEQVNEKDDVLFYLAADALAHEGHCRVLCADSINNPGNAASFITDEEIAAIAKNITCASVTFILQVDHAATTHWLDTSKSQNILFASCRYDEEPGSYNKQTDEGNYCMFTYCLAESIKKNGINLSNRNLFADAMLNYANNKPEEVNGVKTPQLFCDQEAYNKLFLQGNSNTVILQNLLRQTAYCDEKTTGKWNKLTAYALDMYCKENGLPKDLSKQDYISSLRLHKQNKTGNDLPIFLLLFSDPKNKLPAILEERKMILETLHAIDAQVEIMILDNPAKADLQKVFSDKRNRNRVELFYYAGKDDEGQMILKDGTFGLGEMITLLDYQENIKLFFANSCRSQILALYMSQLGIAYAIGAFDEIRDDTAADFGKSLFKLVVDKNDIQENLGFAETGIDDPGAVNKEYKLHKASWLPADSKIIWNIESITNDKPELYAVIIAFDQYEALGNISGAVESAVSFSAWIKTQTNEENYFTITGEGTQAGIDDALQKLYDLARASISRQKKLIVYMNGRGVGNTVNPVFCLPSMSERLRNNGLNIQAYFSTLSASGIFDNVIVFYDLLQAESFTSAGLQPLFGSPVPIKNAIGILMGNIKLAGTSYQLNARASAENKHGNFTRKLLDGLNGAATGIDGNITARSLNDFIKNDQPAVVTAFVGDAADFIIATGKAPAFQKVTITFAEGLLKRTLHLLDNGSNKIDTVLLERSPVEFELKPGLYIAEIAETTLRQIFAVEISAVPIAVDISFKFRKKWVGVIGTGLALTEQEVAASKAIGIFLAEQGYGLVTGGWPGVDYVVSESYYTLVSSYGEEKMNDYFMQIVENKREADFKKGNIIKVAEDDWDNEVMKKCFAFISIGGQGYTYEMFKDAQKLNYPFIPLPFTGNDSGKVYKRLSTAKQSIIPPELIKQLGEMKAADADCMQLLEKILNGIKNGPIGWKKKYYNDLLNEISNLYPLSENIQVIAKKAGLNTTTLINFNGSGLMMWNAVLNSAEQADKVIPLIECLFEEQPSNQLLDGVLRALKEEADLTTINKKSNEDFKATVERLYKERPVTISSDLQKNRWGGIAERNGRALKAVVTQKGSKNFTVKVTIESPERSRSNRKQQVAFFLHETFPDEIIYETMLDSEVTIELQAYEAFTIGAYLEYGTELELDLNKQPGYPEDFYYKDVAENLNEKVESIGSDGFYTEHGIKTLVERSGKMTKLDPVQNVLLIFNSSKQHTWLVFTGLITYVLLDDEDTRKKNSLIQTSFEKHKTLPIQCKDSTQSKGSKVVQFAAQDTWWYYSQKLFPSYERLSSAIGHMINVEGEEVAE